MRAPFALESRGYKIDPTYQGPGTRFVHPEPEKYHFHPVVWTEADDRGSVDPVMLIAHAAFAAGMKAALDYAQTWMEETEASYMMKSAKEKYKL